MIKYPTVIHLIFLVLLTTSCATYRSKYTKATANWQENSPSSSGNLKHTMYLVGDAGNSRLDGSAPVLTYLKTKLDSESENSSILFLGDNIYEYGMPPAEEVEKREIAEHRITAQLKILDDFKGRPIFIPGNHDWRGWGQRGLKRQENFIESYLNERRGKFDKDDWENYFVPDDGCSGPQVVELNDQVVIIVVDSQWWLGDSDTEPKFNNGCEARNRATFKFIFENVVRKYRNHNVVIALHHPPYTYGPHGAGFTAKQHIFPLTDINQKLYVPLPGIGTAEALFRSGIGSRQDVSHHEYKELRAALLAGAKKNGNFIFVSGHEHVLQYIENEDQKFIVSGSGSKSSPVKLGKGSEFASGAMGYSTLSFYEGGEVWAQFWEVNSAGDSAKLIFQKKVKDKLSYAKDEGEIDFSEYNSVKDSVTRSVTKNNLSPTGKIHRFFLGTHHRDLYLQKYSFPVLDLDAFQGGVTPIKVGGGNQTNSLRVRDSTGREYVLRGMNKDVSRFLPYPFNRMVAAKFLVEDNFLATHPFAPLAIPPLADAISVYHTNPQLYYIPAQPALGIHNRIFGGSLHLVEERAAGKHWKDAEFFGHPEKIISTSDLTENILKNNNHKVDEAWALRARMLDFLVGDWDRHDDQWTWASSEQEDGTKRYRPIPRDRDQAFSRYDGFIPGVARQTLPFLRQLQTFGPEIASMKWTTWSARLFDRTFLNSLSWQEWEAEVKFIQDNLTDEVIDNAFLNWPEKAREISATEIKSSLRRRRDDLMTIARTHYEFLSKSVDVIGTDDSERFEIERLDDKHTRVTVYQVSKKGEIKKVNFQRIFENEVTRAINIYGNGDGDEFLVTGEVRKGVKLRLIGGLGNDLFNDRSVVGSGARKTLVYDDLRKNTVNPGPETRDRRTKYSRYNIYDRRGYDSEYDITMPFPVVGFNPDDLFLFGGSINIIHHGFKSVPYSSAQRIGGSFASGTLAFKVNYEADFLNVIKHWDFYLDARYHGPTYAFNFAGLGNMTVRTVDDPDYYRVRQGLIHFYPAIKKRFSGINGFFTIGPAFEAAKIENTPGRFINSYDPGENINLFERKYFAGTKMGFHFNNVDNFFEPHSGIKLNSTFQWSHNLLDDRHFTAWRTSLSFYRPIDKRENIIFATQFGWGQNFGTGYEFWQMPSLGGQQGLRGYRNERFYGDRSFWQSTDFRFRLKTSDNPILPFTIGVFGSFDYGRVWLESEETKQWHNSYGGGVWFAPVDILVFTFESFIPKEKFEESPRFVFRIGFDF